MNALVALRAPSAFTADLPPLPKDPLSPTTGPSSGDKVRVVYLGQSSCRLTNAQCEPPRWLGSRHCLQRAVRRAGKGTPTSGQSSRWGPAQPAGGGRTARREPPGWLGLRHRLQRAERRAGKGTPTSGRHSPPEAGGSRDVNRGDGSDCGTASSGRSGVQARERRPPVGTARRRRADHETRTAGMARIAAPPPAGGAACRQGNADLRSAQPAGGGRTTRREPPGWLGSRHRLQRAERRAGKGTPTSGRHSPPQAGGSRDVNRGDGSDCGTASSGRSGVQARERRPPVGTARRRRADREVFPSLMAPASFHRPRAIIPP